MPSHEQLTAVLDAAATVLARRQQQMLTIEEWADDPAGFVASMNLHRRHLTTSQRAMIAARLVTTTRGRPPKDDPPIGGLTQPDAAVAMKVSERAVQRAAAVLASGGPALVDAVTQGQVSVSAAEQVATGGPHVVQNSGPGVGAGGGSSDSRVRTSPTRR